MISELGQIFRGQRILNIKLFQIIISSITSGILLGWKCKIFDFCYWYEWYEYEYGYGGYILTSLALYHVWHLKNHRFKSYGTHQPPCLLSSNFWGLTLFLQILIYIFWRGTQKSVVNDYMEPFVILVSWRKKVEKVLLGCTNIPLGRTRVNNKHAWLSLTKTD